MRCAVPAVAEPAGRPVERESPARAFRTNTRLWRAVGSYALLGLLVGLAILLISHALGAEPSPVLCLGLPAALAAVAQLLRATVNEMVPVESRPEPAPASTTEYFVRLRQLERRLEGASTDGTKFAWNVRPVLAQLAAERLRHRHAIIIRRDPERARAMLGEQLWQIVTSPPNAPGTAQNLEQLSRLVASIERL